MNLQNIADTLDLTEMGFNPSKNKEGEINPDWFRAWNNEKRIAISIPTDLLEDIKANPELDNLGLQHKVIEGKQGPYDAYRIVRYKPAHTTFSFGAKGTSVSESE